MRIGKKRFLICLIILFGSLILSYQAFSQPETDIQKDSNSSSPEEIIKLYEELIALRQHDLDQKMYLLEIGLTSPSDLIEPEIKLAEARIQLAEFQGKNEIVIEELQKIEKLLQKIRAQQKQEVDSGQSPIDGLNDIDARIVEIKIILAKTKLNNSKVPNNVQSKSELQFRLKIANKINDIQIRNKALAGIAKLAVNSGEIEFMKEVLKKINDINIQNNAVSSCITKLAHANKTQDALEIVNMINDIKLKNEMLLHISTMN